MVSKEDVLLRLRSYLLGLMEIEPNSKDELSAWYRKSRDVKSFLEEGCGEIDIPHFLWHYLEDADIRLKDPRYGIVQVHQLKEFVDSLRR